MNSALSIALSLVGGAILGAAYLAVLWASVRAAARGGGLSPIAIGAVARLVMVLAAAYGVVTVGAGGYDMLAVVAGFMAARFIGVGLARFDVPTSKGKD
jgi:N-ATPase, AtpR subunit